MSGVAAARLLDLTRLTRRAGRPLTGVDRVEQAYLRACLADEVPCFGLVRSRAGYLLLEREGMSALLGLSQQVSAPSPALFDQLMGRDPRRTATETALRARRLDRALPSRLAQMLRRHLPSGTVYINTGHSNLTDRVLHAVRQLDSARIAVLVHDTIPLDVPQYQRPGTAEAFAGFVRRVARSADLVICNSFATQTDFLRHAARYGQPETCVAHLGIDLPKPEDDHLPAERPYFVIVGTIEPRKNHALLLDIWEGFAKQPDAPTLVICGARGWNNEAVFRRLDARPAHVLEWPGLTDAQVAGIVRHSAGALFPSFAEGYGLPPIEAAALGVPVVTHDLPVYREVLGDIPVYADIGDRYLWTNKIKDLAGAYQAEHADPGSTPPRFEPPTWEAHFKTVLSMI